MFLIRAKAIFRASLALYDKLQVPHSVQRDHLVGTVGVTMQVAPAKKCKVVCQKVAPDTSLAATRYDVILQGTASNTCQLNDFVTLTQLLHVYQTIMKVTMRTLHMYTVL